MLITKMDGYPSDYPDNILMKKGYWVRHNLPTFKVETYMKRIPDGELSIEFIPLGTLPDIPESDNHARKYLILDMLREGSEGRRASYRLGKNWGLKFPHKHDAEYTGIDDSKRKMTEQEIDLFRKIVLGELKDFHKAQFPEFLSMWIKYPKYSWNKRKEHKQMIEETYPVIIADFEKYYQEALSSLQE